MPHDYLREALSPPAARDTIEKAVQEIRPYAAKFDAIAVTGSSGLLIGPTVAYLLQKGVILVRKPGTSTHSSRRVEGDDIYKRYIIVDDLISSGDTIERIKEATSSQWPGIECIGTYLYKSGRWYEKPKNAGREVEKSSQESSKIAD